MRAPGWPAAAVGPLTFAHRAAHLMGRRDAASRAVRADRSAFYADAWRRAAEEAGGAVRDLGGDILEITLGGRRHLVCRNYTPLDSPVVLQAAGDKPLVLRLMAEAGLRVPRHLAFRSGGIEPARRFIDEVGRPCVVKPARNTAAGTGVTTGVGRDGLVGASALAAASGRDLLIEEQLEGLNLRLLYLDGVLLDAVERQAPTVTGDGEQGIDALVEAENRARLDAGGSLGQVLITRDRDMRSTLASQGLTLKSVPASGRRVTLKTVVNQNDARHTINVTERLAPELVEDGARAAAVLGVRLAGVDVITPDPSVPLAQSGGAINEVNTTPGFYHHYLQQGGFCAVAAHVLQALTEEAAPERAGAAGGAR